jgi:DNA (cytosine-5)-methyltransferase 1
MLRVIKDIEPRFVFAENVSEVAINIAADDLESVGYQVRFVDLSAADLGADHIRKRYWLLAHADFDGELLGALHDAVESVPRICARLWATSPNQCGMDDGVAHRMDRLVAIGNGQVPAVAARAWQLLSGALK